MEESYVGYIGEYFEISLFKEATDILLSLQTGSTLPQGISLNSKTNVIEGYPKEIYRQTVTFVKKNIKSGKEEIETTLIFIKEARQLSLVTTQIPDITAGEEYSYQLEYRGGIGEIEFISDTLPDGLTLSKVGHLQGKAKISGGMFPLLVTIKDQAGHEVKREFHICIQRKTE